MERPPKSIEEFSESFLLSIDETFDVGNLGPRSIAIENFNTDIARFSDNIVPNKKYYYAFRSITFHGTPSELSPIIEIELQKDSDEYRIVSKEYKIENVKNYSNKKMAKRLMRIIPNIDRLVFTNEDSPLSWDLDEGNLVTNRSSDSKTFKIRVTSKHTGKKIDLNVTFKINRDGSFFSSSGPN